MGKTPEQLFHEREKRVNDAIQLKTPDRVPITSLFGFFPARYTGITFEEAMYDHDKAMKAWIETMTTFEPDMVENPFPQRVWGKIQEILDGRQVAWPGHGVDKNSGFQFIEKEYMKPDEYSSFLFDQTDYVLRHHWPQIFGALKPFENLPPIRNMYSYGGLVRLASFATPEMIGALDALVMAGKEAQKVIKSAEVFEEKMNHLGFPPLYGALARAPFDVVSDFFRGTVGTMLDMFRHSDKLFQAIDHFTAIEIEGVQAAKKVGVPRVFIPLHKCIDSFMSPDQFETFFWPSLRKVIVALIDAGLNPVVFWEGDCTSRLETIRDIPAGKAIYAFEKMDMSKAKEVLGNIVCIRGNVPLTLLCTGTPEDIKAYCKKLIDTAGKGGGFIMDASTQFDDAKPENVRAMFDFTKEYGVYR